MKKASISAALVSGVLVISLTLAGCGGSSVPSGGPGTSPWSTGTPTPTITSTPVPTVQPTIAPTEAPTDTPTPIPTQTPAASGKIWDYLGSDMQDFADNFLEDEIFKLEYWFAGEGGLTTYTLYGGDDIQAAFDALDAVTVVEETFEVATDYDEGFVFEDFNDNRYSVSFNMGNLSDNHNHYYLIENDGDLWRLASYIKQNYDPDDWDTPTPTPTASPTPTVTAEPQQGNIESESYGQWRWTREEFSDGSIEYVIDDVLVFDFPPEWPDKVYMVIEDEESEFISYYHKASYEKFMDAYGFPGGLLFTIGYYADDSYKNEQHYEFIGNANGGNYVILYPTDVQGWLDDEDTKNEWMLLMNGMDYVNNSIHMEV